MRNIAAGLSCGLAAALLAGAACAAGFPDRPVTMVVPFSPGGATDQAARVIAERMGEALGQSVIVQNKPGAGTVLGASYVQNSRADGYTILMATNTTLVTSRYLFKTLPFDPDGFAPIGMVGAGPLMLLIGKDRPFATTKDVVDYARQHPGKLTFASFGLGTSSHLAGEYFKSQAGIQIEHVPFKGAAEANLALIRGDVDLYFDTMSTGIPQIQAGKLRALGITSMRRLESVPELATFDEQGYANFEIAAWLSLAAPPKTPPEVVARLEQALVATLKDETVRKRVLTIGFAPSDGTAQELDAQIKSDSALTSRLVKLANIPQQ